MNEWMNERTNEWQAVQGHNWHVLKIKPKKNPMNTAVTMQTQTQLQKEHKLKIHTWLMCELWLFQINPIQNCFSGFICILMHTGTIIVNNKENCAIKWYLFIRNCNFRGGYFFCTIQA